MKKTLIALAMLAACGSVLATNNESHGRGDPHGATSTVSTASQSTAQSNSSSRSSSASSSSSRQHQRQNQTATGGNSTANGGSATGGTGGNAVGGNGGTGGNASNAGNNAQLNNTTNVPRQVASAANATIMPTAVCSGSTAGGAQGAAFGVSFGTSWTDQNCMLLEQARTVAITLAEPEVASEMLCAIDGYREARIRLGRPCLPSKYSSESKPVKANEYTDPIIRSRLGLPPL